MASKFSLNGAMVPRTVKRMIDERSEERCPAGSETAVMEFRGRKHVVRLADTSPSGAMVIFPLVPHIGEQVLLQLLEQGQISARVRWVRDGRIGINFDGQRE
ncbi:PilZ domain-containing protein [Sphingomonas sp.]|uniref:PilZ domain-containing protein n=1 Tax=Sphingomonas sp. TaxID=28214 RepID=UPI00182F9D95|nr:PilZ domain-containing protein [Sphingomonas sp.]MBA3510631.1 PilZ domain-containing protein [Sphingomonas sp.]